MRSRPRRSPARRPLVRRLRPVLPVALVAALALGACSSDEGGGDGPAPEEALDAAAERLVETSGLQLSLSTDDLPDGVTGLTGAEGIATHAPAFEGDLQIRLSGAQFEVPVVSVDDTVWARIPLTPGWSDVDPSEYGAPDPAHLISEDRGFTLLLREVVDPEAGERERGGVDNSEVLTTYTGTIDGEVMEQVIPSSDGDTFDATFLVTEDGELRRAELTGVFYPDSEEMTYTVELTDYGTEQEITAP